MHYKHSLFSHFHLFITLIFSLILLQGCTAQGNSTSEMPIETAVENNAPIAAENRVREYWIAAEKTEWNYIPSGKNLMHEQDGTGVWGEHSAYQKYRYVQYTDGNYTQPVIQPAWMGILGPQIEAVEGDTLKIHFLNRSDKPLSIHPHGVRYDEQNEGADHKGPGAYVEPNQTFTYTWQVDESAAPGPADPSSIVWLYHSHVDSVTEVYDGLIGTLVVTRKGMERSYDDPRPKDVDTSFTALFMIFNENGRPVIDNQGNIQTPSPGSDEEQEGHLKHAINGYIFGNLPGLEVKQGQRVRWHLVGMGTEVDLHTAHWHGKTVLEQGRRTDVVELLPASMKTVDMVADNPGKWMFHCHVADHITAGMSAHWTVNP